MSYKLCVESVAIRDSQRPEAVASNLTLLSCVIRQCIDCSSGTISLSHAVLGDYIVHIFNEMYMGRNVRYVVYHLQLCG